MSSPYALAALGAALIGAGIACLSKAVQDVKNPCLNCGDDEPEVVATEVAKASIKIQAADSPKRIPRRTKKNDEETTEDGTDTGTANS